MTLISLIQELRKKEGIAIIKYTGYRHFSYTNNEIYQKACKFASYLTKKGIEKKDCIFIWGQNSPEWVVAFLGCIIKGVIAVPIDTHHTTEFIEKIQKQVKAKLLVKSSTLLNPEFKIKTETLENLFYTLDSIKPIEPKECKEEDIVEIVYTSGTTGDPKGVVLTHKNLCANLLGLQLIVKPFNNMRVLSVLPLSHLFEQMIGLLFPLQIGAKIIYPPMLKPTLILDMVEKEKISMFLTVPRMLEGITREIENNYGQLFQPSITASSIPGLNKILFAPIRKKFRSIKYIVSGGAPLDPEIENIWQKIGIPILQGYGLTETSPILTYSLPDLRKIGSVGKPMAGVEIKITEEGEIFVKGENVFSGYYKNKEKTKKSFVDGWFKTGDLGEFDKEEFLFLHGRSKDMIKTSLGINVYPEEIENILKKEKGIRDACIIGIPTLKGEQIHAVLLLGKGNPAEIISETNKHLDESQRIDDYSVWPLADFPRTPTMKIKKFEILEQITKKEKIEQKQNTTPVQEIISRFTSKKILPTSRIGIDLGLSSLDRVELASKLEQEFFLEIDENELTQETIISQIEELVKSSKKESLKKIRRWTRNKIINVIRLLLNNVLIYPIIWIFCRKTVIGEENVYGLKTPVIIVANHESHFDAPVILMSIPFYLKKRIAAAAWEEYFTQKSEKWYVPILQLFTYNFATILFNVYMFPQTKGFRKSLRYSGELIDNNWNILIFPEGQRNKGKMTPFKQGIGFLAKEMKIPIIPIKLEGLSNILPAKKFFPSFGKVKVKIGTPLQFTTESIIEITKTIQDRKS